MRISSHLPKKCLMENLILCAVTLSNIYNKAFLKNRKRSLAVNYFHKKSSLINVLQGTKHTSESNRKTSLNPLSANLTKASNTLKQIVGSLPKNCLSVFDHFVGLALKGLVTIYVGTNNLFNKGYGK